MKILFVSSGNYKQGVNIIIQNQRDILLNNIQGINIDLYLIKGKGILGYLKNILPLKRYMRDMDFDIIHAHYAFSAFIASLAGSKNLFITLMGSDLIGKRVYKYIIKCFALLFNWKNIIVQSTDMKTKLGVNSAQVIPNGVDLNMFFPMDKRQSQFQLGWNHTKKHILFPANPKRYEKNYFLAKKALTLLNDENIEIHFFENINHKKTPLWYNASDIILLTSLWEGSPNAIKEAMACNKPVVASAVGDIPNLFGNEEGYFITTFDVNDCADKIKQAFLFSNTNNTKGRERLILLKLDNISFVKKLNELYNKHFNDN